MKKFTKVLMLSLLFALMFTATGCDGNNPSVPNNGDNNTQLPEGNDQGGNEQGGTGDNTPGGDTQGQTEQKPAVETVYDSAKEVGYTGTDTEWKAEVEAQTVVETGFVNSIAKVGDKAPTDDLDSKIQVYFNTSNKRIYVRGEQTSNKWIDKEEVGTVDKINLVSVNTGYMVFDDNKARSIKTFRLSNGYGLFELEEVTVTKVELSSTKLELTDPNFDTALNIVVTLSDNTTFTADMNSLFVVENTIKKELGTYNVTLNVLGVDYKIQVEVINSVTMYDTAKKLGYYGTLDDWNAQVNKYLPSGLENVMFVDGAFATSGIGAPSDKLDPKLNYYFDIANHQIYFRMQDNKWMSKVDMPTTDKVELDWDIDVGCMLFDDNSYKLITTYILTNGYALFTMEDVNVIDVKLSTTTLDLANPNYLYSLNVIVTLDNNKSFEASMNSSLVVENTITNKVGTYNVTLNVLGKEYKFIVEVTNNTKTLYASAKELGFTGSEGEFYDQIKNYLPLAMDKIHFANGQFGILGKGAPTNDLDPKLTDYFDTLNNRLYYRNPDSTNWLDKFDINTGGSTINVFDVNCRYYLLDGDIVLISVITLENGVNLYTLEKTNVIDVKLSQSKVHLHNISKVDLRVIVTLDNNIKFDAPIDSQLVVKNNIKSEVGTYSLVVQVEGKEYNFNVEVTDEVTTVLTEVAMYRNESILVIDKGNGIYDYKLTQRYLILTYNIYNLTGVNEHLRVKAISMNMISHIKLNKGLNNGVINFEGFEVPVSLYVATEDEIRNASAEDINFVADLSDNINQNIIDTKYCELNTDFVSNKYLRYKLNINGCNVFVCERITSEYLVGFDKTKLGFGNYKYAYYGHVGKFELPIECIEVNSNMVDYINSLPFNVLNENPNNLILEVHLRDKIIYKRLNDYTHGKVVTDKVGKHFNYVEYKGLVYEIFNFVYDDDNKVDYCYLENDIVNINNIDNEKLYFYDIFSLTSQQSNNTIEIPFNLADVKYDATILNRPQLATATLYGRKVMFKMTLTDKTLGYCYIPDSLFITQCADKTNLERYLAECYARYNGSEITLTLDMFDLTNFDPNKVGKQYVKFSYDGFEKIVSINISPEIKENPIIQFRGITNLGQTTIEVYKDYVVLINRSIDYYSDFVYDEANGLLKIKGYNIQSCIFGATSNELWIKVDATNGTFELAQVHNEEPLSVYTAKFFSTLFTLKVYSDNRFELHDGFNKFTFSGKYDDLKNGFIYCGFTIKLYNDGTFALL